MSAASEKIGREFAAFSKRENKLKARERVKELGTKLKAARVQRTQLIAAARTACRDNRALLRVGIAQRRAELKAAVAADRIAGRRQCVTTRDATRAETLAKVEGVAHHLAGAKVARALLARSSRATRAAASGLITSAESRAESDDVVRSNLARELVPVFNAARGEIRGTPRTSRTEVFLDWAQENPARVYEIQHAGHAKWLRAMELEERQLRRQGVIGVARTAAVHVTEEWGGA